MYFNFFICTPGRMIPTTPWDSPFHGIASWLGINESSMDEVCPNLHKFKSSPSYLIDVDKMFDLPPTPTQAPHPKTPNPSLEYSAIPSIPPSHEVEPSFSPSKHASLMPTSRPSNSPSQAPQPKTSSPSSEHSAFPSIVQSFIPSKMTSIEPSSEPSVEPSYIPSGKPSAVPSDIPTFLPSTLPTINPSTIPNSSPSYSPSVSPTYNPSSAPTKICDVEQFLAVAGLNTVRVPLPILGSCFGIQFFDTGNILFDEGNASCTNPTYNPQSIAEFSAFSGNEVIFTTGELGFSGKFVLLHRPGISGVQFVPSLTDTVFEVQVLVPSC